MIRELMDLQTQLQEAKSIILHLEEQLETLIDTENRRVPRASAKLRNASPEMPQPRNTSEKDFRYSYGFRYLQQDFDYSGQFEATETQDAAYCIGREENSMAYRRPTSF